MKSKVYALAFGFTTWFGGLLVGLFFVSLLVAFGVSLTASYTVLWAVAVVVVAAMAAVIFRWGSRGVPTR